MDLLIRGANDFCSSEEISSNVDLLPSLEDMNQFYI